MLNERTSVTRREGGRGGRGVRGKESHPDCSNSLLKEGPTHRLHKKVKAAGKFLRIGCVLHNTSEQRDAGV